MIWLESLANPHSPKRAEVLMHDGKASAAGVRPTCFLSVRIRVPLRVWSPLSLCER